MNRLRWGVWLVLAMLVLAACTDQGDPSEEAQGLGVVDGSPRRPVQLVLRQRADRLLAGDVEGYLAPMGPEARAFEEPIAREAAKLPLSQIDMTIGEATISLDGKKFTNAITTFSYRYKDLPKDNPFQLHLIYDLERQDDKWIVTGSRFDDSPGLLPPPLWATGPVEITRSPHFLAMARPGTASVEEMTAKAETGLERLLPKLTLESDNAYLIMLAGNDDEYNSMGGGESLAAAGREYRPSEGGLLRPENRVMIAHIPRLLEADGPATIEDDTVRLPVDTVFQHELAHMALSRFSRPCTDSWVKEGAAMWLADESRMAQWKLMVDSGEVDPPPLSEMGTPAAGQPEPPADYPTALAAVLHLVDLKGGTTFLRFYQNFKELDPPPACKGRTGRTERATGSDRLLRRYYGIDLAGLDVATRDYIRKAVAAG